MIHGTEVIIHLLIIIFFAFFLNVKDTKVDLQSVKHSSKYFQRVAKHDSLCREKQIFENYLKFIFKRQTMKCLFCVNNLKKILLYKASCFVFHLHFTHLIYCYAGNKTSFHLKSNKCIFVAHEHL